MRILADNTTGLVIDLQERLVPVMSNKEELIKNCQVLIQGLEALEVETAVTHQYSKGLGVTIPEIQECITDFKAIEKVDFSCMDETEYASWLKETGKKNVIICGIESHVCVLQTAVDLKDAGFNPIVVWDCVSSRTEENKAISLERLRHEGIMVTSYESILFELTRSAKAPAFKAVSKLVK
ncbi:hydrolase [Prolixibacteraceae bacterium JC049]|nr:hydrolase [Prolixibacteraceae bacterium JC049]